MVAKLNLNNVKSANIASMKLSIENLKAELAAPKKIVIVPHQRPDADALGSCLAWYHYLVKKGHSATVVSPSEYPEFIKWMPGNETVLEYADTKKDALTALFDAADWVFCLDFSQTHRMAPIDTFVSSAKHKIGLVDHHIGKADFADFEYWDIAAGATAELIFLLIEDLGDKTLIDRNIAECLYAGIVTDTGSFKYASTTARIHKIVAELYEIGINAGKIQQLVYDTRTHNQLKFLGFCLSEKLTVLQDCATAYFVISKKELLDNKVQTGDTEGIVNYALSIKGINLAAIFIEYDDEVRISFRSFGVFNVANIASEKYFGGGHKNAAGGRRTDGLSNAVADFLTIVEKQKSDIIDSAVEKF
jgi:phosphoesterase RecJ-like protein